jgi:hypothetical protein
MREPIFNETLQLGIVVRDLEATMRRYVDDCEIEVYEFNAGAAEDSREYGQPVEDFAEAVAQADRGNGVILSGEFGGARVAYLGTDRDLGVIIEIFSGTPDDRPQPDETDP